MKSSRPDQKGVGLAGGLCIGFFVFGIAAWLALGNVVLGALRTTFAGQADGLGMGLFAFVIYLVSGCALVVAIVLSLFARRLSRLFRILSLLPAAGGIATAALIMHFLRVHGK
jgi:hypothetical protein